MAEQTRVFKTKGTHKLWMNAHSGIRTSMEKLIESVHTTVGGR
jgi:hypothetical protein